MPKLALNINKEDNMLSQETHLGTFGGRPITQKEFSDIRDTVEMFGNLSRTELTHTICEHLDWRTASGTNKWDACLKMLKGMERRGMICLPAKKARAKSRPKKIAHSTQTDPGQFIRTGLNALDPVHLVPAESRKQIDLWNEYTDRYHYLGYRRPFGYTMRYFIRSGDLPLGCLLFSGAARAISARDTWIGWTADQRLKNRHLVVNNARFLIFPWVDVQHLASHVLGMASRQIARDWKRQWRFAPALLETFVDPAYYKGTAYKAANWQDLGYTAGKGVVRNGKSYTTRPRKIFVLPLAKNFRGRLCNHV